MAYNDLKKLIKANPNANKDSETLKMWSSIITFPMDVNDIIAFRESPVYEMLNKENMLTKEKLDLLSDSYALLQKCSKIYAEELIILWADTLCIDILPEVIEGEYLPNPRWNRKYAKVIKVHNNICVKCGSEFVTYKRVGKRCLECENILEMKRAARKN